MTRFKCSAGLRGSRCLLFAILPILVILPAGCGDDDDGVEPRRIYTLTYSLNITGESSVDQVTYAGGGKDITFNNPEDGWSVQFPGGDGQFVGASAEGTVKNGAIILFMRAEITSESPITGQDECSESEGTSTICSLEIPKVRLP